MTTSVSKPLTQAETIFKSLVWDPLIAMGETALFAAVPVLDAPVLGAVDKEVISIASDFLWNQFVQFIDVTTIKFANANHQSAFESAELRLNVIIATEGINSDAFIQARQLEGQDFASLVRVNQ